MNWAFLAKSMLSNNDLMQTKHKLGRIVEHKVTKEANTQAHFGNENCFFNLEVMEKKSRQFINHLP